MTLDDGASTVTGRGQQRQLPRDGARRGHPDRGQPAQASTPPPSTIDAGSANVNSADVDLLGRHPVQHDHRQHGGRQQLHPRRRERLVSRRRPWRRGLGTAAAHTPRPAVARARAAVGRQPCRGREPPRHSTQPWIAELQHRRVHRRVPRPCWPAPAGAARPTWPDDPAGDRGGGGEPADAPYRLFQPLSRRYYLVTRQLACRRPGHPRPPAGAGATTSGRAS